jgi:hypothetical protein
VIRVAGQSPANGAAVIPRQWGPRKGALPPYIGVISGTVPKVGASFRGFADVQTGLMALNPGLLIIEQPGAPVDYGVTEANLSVPQAVGYPTGTGKMK